MAASVRRTARIDLRAFQSNLRSLLELDDQIVVDARADAYGHGVIAIVRAALEVGVSTIRVSPAQSALPGVRRSALMTVPSVRRLVGPEAYGLDGPYTAVMTLSGEIVAVKPTEAGAGVSYGYTYRTERPTTLALVALGYADGVPRLASNRASVAIADRQLPLVGRVAMDQFVVDCGDAVPALGDAAVLFGQRELGQPTAGEWAIHTERTALQLTAGLGSRIERVYE